MANVIPLFKKGDRSQPNNYRPISLTSITSKIFEHILSSNIMKHLEVNNILNHHQHGFRHNHSCKTQLVSLIQDLSLNFDNDIQTDLISMDFAKAFDTVPHCRLLYKLQWYGIQGKVHSWIYSKFFIRLITNSYTGRCTILFNISDFRSPSGDSPWTNIISHLYKRFTRLHKAQYY